MSPLASPSKPSQPKPSETRNQVTVPTPDHVVETIVLDVEGMMCAGCVSSVEKKLAQCEGVTKATVNLVTEVAAVDCLPSADPHQIAQALTEAGYPSTLRQTKGLSDNPGLQAETDWLQRKEAAQKNQTTQLAIAGTLLLLSTLGHLQHLSFASSSPFKAWLELPIISTLWFHGALATLTLLFPARTILIEGFQGIQRKSPNMNTLVSLGALSAYVTSLAALLFPRLGWECFFDEPVMLLSFILIGRALEQRAQFQAARSLRSLIALQPTLARLTTNPSSSSSTPSTIEQPTDVKIPASQVQIGEWLR
ncbi:MAG: cation transporter, partial [Cyanobacteria bacterium P01_F01_bin.3]